jgi:DNA mismatch endonuclease (patch repair protein)
LKSKVREQTLESLAFTLNHIWMKDHQVIAKPYPQFDEEEDMMKAAEE